MAGSGKIPRGESVKLAIIVPVPDLTKFGYGRIAAECIGSMARIADIVYLVSSTRNDDGAYKIASEHDNVRLISDEATYFSRTPEGAEWFDPYKVMENATIGMTRAEFGRYDVAACLMCNQYIPEASEFYQHCYYAIDHNMPALWVYRMDQLGTHLLHASVKEPFIVNLNNPCGARWSTDALYCDGMISRMDRGGYAEFDAISVVDVQLEVTREELAEKQNYIRCYHDILPKRKPVFEWDYWFPYYVDKFRQKSPAGTVTDPVGLAIAAKSEPGFVSQQVLAAL